MRTRAHNGLVVRRSGPRAPVCPPLEVDAVLGSCVTGDATLRRMSSLFLRLEDLGDII